jgi:hypothetical protein
MAHDNPPADMAPPSAFAGTRDPVTGQVLVMPDQDLDAYYAFVKKYTAQYQPKTHDEQQMVRTIADTQWRLNRSRAIENNFLSYHTSQLNNIVPSNNTDSQTALTMARMAAAFSREIARMSLAEKRLTSIIESTRRTLLRTQKARIASHEASMKVAAAIRTMREKQQQTWNPADDGVNHTLDEIDAHRKYENLVSQAKSFSARC